MSSALPQELRLTIEVSSTGGCAVFLHAAEPQAALQTERDLGRHVGELLLDQLVGGERPAELLAVEHILACRVRSRILGGSERAPGNAEAGRVQAGKRAFEARHVGQQVLFRHEDVVHAPPHR